MAGGSAGNGRKSCAAKAVAAVCRYLSVVKELYSKQKHLRFPLCEGKDDQKGYTYAYHYNILCRDFEGKLR